MWEVTVGASLPKPDYRGYSHPLMHQAGSAEMKSKILTAHISNVNSQKKIGNNLKRALNSQWTSSDSINRGSSDWWVRNWEAEHANWVWNKLLDAILGRVGEERNDRKFRGEEKSGRSSGKSGHTMELGSPVRF